MIATGATRPEGANLPRDAATPGKDATPVLVVLVTADTIGGGDADVALMRKTICRAEPAARVLLLVTGAEGVALAHKLADAKIELELLLAPEIAGDLPPVVHARVPPNTRSGDQEDFALALADVVLADAGSHAHGLVRRARHLGKPVIPPGHGLPVLPPIESVADRLDPLALPGHKWRGQICGRLEQFFVRLLGLFAVQEEPFDKRWARLRECFRRDGKWRPESNFAPACCEPLAPDNGGYHATSPLVTRFDVLDRSAVFGAYMHRDLQWIAHFGAAFAVLSAVAGAISHRGWLIGLFAAIELVLLLTVLSFLYFARRGRLQDRWTACRLAAEQLRIARMCLPLLVLQRALISRDIWPGQPPQPGDPPALTRAALAEVKRAVRDHGLPRLQGDDPQRQAARWVDCIVDAQIKYHKSNRHRLECAENSLRGMAKWLFFAALAAVVAEIALRLLGDGEWPPLLLATAAGPAFAAAFHGAATRLALVHRIVLSEDVERELRPIHEALSEIVHRPDLKPDAWAEIRKLAFDAGEAMGRENRSWHGLVRLQQDNLP